MPSELETQQENLRRVNEVEGSNSEYSLRGNAKVWSF